jgi:hypothetical protein
MRHKIQDVITFIATKHGINDKSALIQIVANAFLLTKDRCVYYCKEFAIRFSSSNKKTFSNTVLSLSNLQKFDDRPFLVCLVTPYYNYLFLANTTFLKKISHSSQLLRENNIRGSFNGSDIMRLFEGIENVPDNFERLFNIHDGIGFDGNLARLVEATNNISPSGIKYSPTNAQIATILSSPDRAISFVSGNDYKILKKDLDFMVNQYKNEILLAALIENTNVRGRIIEYLIAGEDAHLRKEIIDALTKKSYGIPHFKTENALGDYSRKFNEYYTETDVKTKIMVLDSNPKAYNLDKVLDFLANERSVFMIYFVGIEPGKIINTVLVSMFQEKLLNATLLLKHWSGRNSRGVSQFEGKAIGELILSPKSNINKEKSISFLQQIMAL